MLKCVFTLLIATCIFSSCGNTDSKNNKALKTSVKLSSTVISNKESLEFIDKFYHCLYKDEFLSISDFRFFFGTFYDEGERFLKRADGTSKSEVEQCFKKPQICKSTIFSDMSKRKKEITFGYKYSKIKTFIEKSEISNKKILVFFPNKMSVVFYLNDNSKLNNILINNKYSFLAKYEE